MQHYRKHVQHYKKHLQHYTRPCPPSASAEYTKPCPESLKVVWCSVFELTVGEGKYGRKNGPTECNVECREGRIIIRCHCCKLLFLDDGFVTKESTGQMTTFKQTYRTNTLRLNSAEILTYVFFISTIAAVFSANSCKIVFSVSIM